MPEPTLDNIDDLFDYHAPTEAQIAQMKEVRTAAKAFAKVILQQTPRCADRTSALRHLSDALMQTNRAIVLDGKW